MNVVDWSLVCHHWDRLTCDHLWVLTVDVWYYAVSWVAAGLVLLGVLVLTNLVLLRVCTSDVFLLLLLLKAISRSSGPRYFIIWLLKLLLRQLVLAYLTLVFGTTTRPLILLILWMSLISICWNLVGIRTKLIRILLILLIILWHLLLSLLLLIKLKCCWVVIKDILFLRRPIPILCSIFSLFLLFIIVLVWCWILPHWWNIAFLDWAVVALDVLGAVAW